MAALVAPIPVKCVADAGYSPSLCLSSPLSLSSPDPVKCVNAEYFFLYTNKNNLEHKQKPTKRKQKNNAGTSLI